MRTATQLGALGRRRLGEMASAASLISLDGSSFATLDSGRYTSKLADAKPSGALFDQGRVRRLIAKIRESYSGVPRGQIVSLDDAVARGILTKEGARAFKGCATVVVSGSDGSEGT